MEEEAPVVKLTYFILLTAMLDILEGYDR